MVLHVAIMQPPLQCLRLHLPPGQPSAQFGPYIFSNRSVTGRGRPLPVACGTLRGTGYIVLTNDHSSFGCNPDVVSSRFAAQLAGALQRSAGEAPAPRGLRLHRRLRLRLVHHAGLRSRHRRRYRVDRHRQHRTAEKGPTHQPIFPGHRCDTHVPHRRNLGPSGKRRMGQWLWHERGWLVHGKTAMGRAGLEAPCPCAMRWVSALGKDAAGRTSHALMLPFNRRLAVR